MIFLPVFTVKLLSLLVCQGPRLVFAFAKVVAMGRVGTWVEKGLVCSALLTFGEGVFVGGGGFDVVRGFDLGVSG